MTEFTENNPGRPLAAIYRPEWLRKLLVLAIVAIGVTIFWVVIDGERSGAHTILLSLLSAGCLWVALAVYRAPGTAVILTEDGLFDDRGEMLCAFSDMERIDSGLLSFKPSKGFTVLLKTPAPRGWSPGLWWRLGRRCGVGGATPGRDGKAMAELLTNMLAKRDGQF